MATATMPERRFNERGRKADRPGQVPAKGWKDVLVRIKGEVKHDRLSLISAGMAYYMLFSLVPAITGLILVYAWISDPHEIQQHLESMGTVIPPEAKTIIDSQLSSLAGKGSALGFSAIIAVLISLWSASKGAKALMEAMNIIHDEEESRGFFKLNLTALGITLLALALSLVAIGVVVGTPIVTSFLNLQGSLALLITIGSYIVLLALFALFLSVSYRFAPSRKKPKWRWVSWGAVIAAVLFVGASALFSWYASNFGSFNKTYGSLGAIIVLMMWFYISSFVILLGGEVNAELEHQTMRDSTTGAHRPIGQRGAEMADTVGKASEEENDSHRSMVRH